ncbi:hypothetical protein [Streptococcus fryi]
MNPNELLDKAKELIAKGDLNEAKKFIEDNKDNLGEYVEKAKGLLDSAGGVDKVLDKVKGLFGK